MAIEIRSITEKDIGSFQSAVGSVVRERQFLAFLDSPSMEMTKAFVLGNIKNNWPHMVAVEDDRIIGWCDIASLNRAACEHSGTLGIGLLNGFRSQGLGEQLIRAALLKAKKKGLTRIQLTVRVDNLAAINLYKKLGFVIEGTHKNSLLIDGQYADQFCMALLFE